MASAYTCCWIDARVCIRMCLLVYSHTHRHARETRNCCRVTTHYAPRRTRVRRKRNGTTIDYLSVCAKELLEPFTRTKFYINIVSPVSPAEEKYYHTILILITLNVLECNKSTIKDRVREKRKFYQRVS